MGDISRKPDSLRGGVPDWGRAETRVCLGLGNETSKTLFLSFYCSLLALSLHTDKAKR